MMNQGCGYIYLGQESEEKLDYTMQFEISVCILTILVFQSHIIWSDQVSCYIIAMMNFITQFIHSDNFRVPITHYVVESSVPICHSNDKFQDKVYACQHFQFMSHSSKLPMSKLYWA